MFNRITKANAGYVFSFGILGFFFSMLGCLLALFQGAIPIMFIFATCWFGYATYRAALLL